MARAPEQTLWWGVSVSERRWIFPKFSRQTRLRTSKCSFFPCSVTQRFKDIQKKGANLADGAPNDEKWLPLFSDEKDIPKVNKGKGNVVAGPYDNIINDSWPPLSPQGSPETLVINTSLRPHPRYHPPSLPSPSSWQASRFHLRPSLTSFHNLLQVETPAHMIPNCWQVPLLYRRGVCQLTRLERRRV